MQVYSLISTSSLQTDQLITFYPLVTGHVLSCAILTPRKAHSPAAISAHLTYSTHCQFCHTRYSFTPESSEACESKMSCPRKQHWNNVSLSRGEKQYIYLKILHQAGFETTQQASSLANLHALTIAPRLSLSVPRLVPVENNKYLNNVRANEMMNGVGAFDFLFPSTSYSGQFTVFCSTWIAFVCRS